MKEQEKNRKDLKSSNQNLTHQLIVTSTTNLYYGSIVSNTTFYYNIISSIIEYPDERKETHPYVKT